MSYDSFKNITFSQLEGLIALIEQGSFTKASERLFISQSALTKQILNLENAVGAKLINRSVNGVTLTPEGRLLYDYAKKVFRLREETKSRLKDLKSRTGGKIFIATSNNPGTYILPRLLSEFRKRYPEILIQISMSGSDEVIQNILDNQGEIGFVGEKVNHKKIVSFPLWKDELVLVAPTESVFLEKRVIDGEMLQRLPLIMREYGSGTRKLIETSLERDLGIRLSKLNVVCEMGSAEAVKEAVAAGLGVSFISIFALKSELSRGLFCTLELKGCSMERYFYLIYKKNIPLQEYHKLFIEFVKLYKVF